MIRPKAPASTKAAAHLKTSTAQVEGALAPTATDIDSARDGRVRGRRPQLSRPTVWIELPGTHVDRPVVAAGATSEVVGARFLDRAVENQVTVPPL